MNKTHWKTFTWVIVSGIVIWVGAYIEIRDVYLSFMAAFWAVVLKTPFFWVHEHVWEVWAKR